MFDNVNWVLLTGMSVGLYQVMRVIKPQIYRATQSMNFAEETQKLSVLFMALVLGVGSVLVAGNDVSIIKGTELNQLHPFMGQLVTGLAIGSGSTFLNFIHQFSDSFRDLIQKWVSDTSA
jgi:hypothetical protein